MNHHSYHEDIISYSAQAIEMADRLLTDDSFASQKINRVLHDEMNSLLSRRERSLKHYEDAVQYNIKEQQWNAHQKEVLLEVQAALPTDLKAEFKESTEGSYWCSLKLAGKISITLVHKYGGSSSSWRHRQIVGESLEVNFWYGSKATKYPRKTDGTFSLDKLEALVRENLEIVKAREEKLSEERTRETNLKRAVQPFYEYGVYGEQHDFREAGLTVRAHSDGTFSLIRTTHETLTEEQLTAILDKEVGRKEQHQF